MKTINGTVTVETFVINSTSVNEYLLYLIGLDISTKYPLFGSVDRHDLYTRVHDLQVSIHHGVYVSVQYTATFECDGNGHDNICGHRSAKLPRIIVGDNQTD